VSEDKKDQRTDFSEYARNRPPGSPEENEGEPKRGNRVLRGCAIALGIAALIFFFIVGACFISMSRW
jgi:hypothetical protein